MKIWADQNIVIIDRRNGEKDGPISFHYDSEIVPDLTKRVGVWYWRSDQSTNPIQISSSFGALGLSQGYLNPFSVRIKPGEIYHFRIAYIGNNEEMTSDGVEIIIAGILKDGQSDFGIQKDKNSDFSKTIIGGTYIDYFFETQKKVMGIFCEFSHQVWKVDPVNQMFYYTPGTASYMALNNIPDNRHRITVQPLSPGTVYYVMALLMDEKGRWQFFQDARVTLQREVNMLLQRIDIIWNGEEPGDAADDTNFLHTFHISNENQQIICHHLEKGFYSGSLLSPLQPWILYIGFPYSTLPVVFSSQFLIPLRSYDDDVYITCETLADGSVSARSFNLGPAGSQPLYFITGLNEGDSLERRIKAVDDTPDDDRFEYDLVIQYHCNYR